MTEHIENNIHLTQEDKLNLKNLGVNVKLYGAVGDGNADDTSAFTEALENNNRVYVPEGTYKITGELIVRDNCELELAQDAVLNFRSATNEVIPEAFKCITLSSSSQLVGNHATIRVPYTFEGSVIRIAANPEDDTSCRVPRYLKDINIVKLIESGEHEYSPASLDNETNGTALLIEGLGVEENSTPSILWGVEASGIRIAGAFDYGIKCVNTNHELSGKKPWKYETCIDALIESCRTGLYMDHYNNARISAVIQTCQAYRLNLEEEESLNYAEYGIHLVNCRYIDLKNSRIIDKDPESGDLAVSDEFKHINLVGDCRGLMIDSSLCSVTEGLNIRDYIHTTTPENFDNMSVWGEPSSRFFELGDYGTSNLYKDYRIKSQGAMTKVTGITATDYISCKKGDTVKLNNIDLFTGKNLDYHKIVFYGYDTEENDTIKWLFTINADAVGDKSYIVFDKANSNFNINESCGRHGLSEDKVTDINGKLNNIQYFRICCDSAELTYNSSIEVNNNKTAFKFGELKNGIRIDAQQIKGLKERVQNIKATS